MSGMEREPRDEDVIDLREYWRVVWGRKWSIISLAGVITLATAMVVFSLKPVYRATAMVMVESSKSNVVSIEEIYGIEGAGREYFQTQFEILKSRTLVDRLVTKLKLVDHAEYLPDDDAPRFDFKRYLPAELRVDERAPTAAERHDEVVEAVIERLTIAPVRNTQLVKISFEANDPALARDVPNQLADLYIVGDLEGRLSMTQKATTWLTERLGGLRKQLEGSEQRLQAFRDRSGLVDIQGVSAAPARQLEQAMSRLAASNEKRTVAESLHRQVQSLKGRSLEAYESLPAVLRHPLVQQFKAAEAEAGREVAELTKRYGAKHPKMVAARSKLEAAQGNTRQQIAKVVTGIEKEFEAARANEQAQQREVARLKKELQEINRKEYELETLERDATANRELYGMFLTRFKETDVAVGMQSAIARVVDPSVLPREPSKPRKGLILAVSLVLGMLFGVLLAFLREHLDNTFKGQEDTEQRLGLTVLGFLPLLKLRGKLKHRAFRTLESEPKGAFAECVRTVRTGVTLSGLDDPHKVLVVTSSVPGEGKSTVAASLAMSLAQMETVLLIDADLRRPSIGTMFELDGKESGLSALVAGTEEGSDCIHRTEIENLHVLPAGIVPPNPLELLASKRFADLLEKLASVYDRIVIDSAPTHAVSDAMVLSRHASAVLYVVKADDTTYHVAQTGIRKLRQVDAPLLGVVLNQIDLKKASRYYGKYGYYGYGSYSYAEG